MTKNSQGQIVVHNKESILYWFERANYQDCRINAYPAFLSEAEERDYNRGINLNLFAPNILFIDLDTMDKSKKESQYALKQILKNIGKVLHDVRPLVIWSGHGYHIIIPVNAKDALENFKDFEPSQAFLQFAGRWLLTLHYQAFIASTIASHITIIGYFAVADSMAYMTRLFKKS